LAGAGAGEGAGRIAGLQAEAAAHYTQGLPTETLGEAYLRDTLNNRDEAWGVNTQRPQDQSLKKPRVDRH